MKMYLLSDNIDTLAGMRLSGVKGEVVHSENHAKKALEEIMQNKEIAILLITKEVKDLVEKEINYYKLNLKTPLIIEIPDRHGNGQIKDSITKYVEEAIGIKIQ